MGDLMGLILQTATTTLRAIVDNSPERAFHIVSGLVLVTIAFSIRRSLN
jgi:hypothetical protein